MKPFYTISVLTRDEFKSSMSSMINSMLAIIYALLALSIIIAIFGIVNTLALNVSERTKEIGLLRAIGTSNGQVRGMLAIEAVILSVFGTLVGIVVGVAAGVVIRIAYESQGMTTLTIPWDQLVLFLIVAILVGLIASISPARQRAEAPRAQRSRQRVTETRSAVAGPGQSHDWPGPAVICTPRRPWHDVCAALHVGRASFSGRSANEIAGTNPGGSARGRAHHRWRRRVHWSTPVP